MKKKEEAAKELLHKAEIIAKAIEIDLIDGLKLQMPLEEQMEYNDKILNKQCKNSDNVKSLNACVFCVSDDEVFENVTDRSVIINIRYDGFDYVVAVIVHYGKYQDYQDYKIHPEVGSELYFHNTDITIIEKVRLNLEALKMTISKVEDNILIK